MGVLPAHAGGPSSAFFCIVKSKFHFSELTEKRTLCLSFLHGKFEILIKESRAEIAQAPPRALLRRVAVSLKAFSFQPIKLLENRFAEKGFCFLRQEAGAEPRPLLHLGFQHDWL